MTNGTANVAPIDDRGSSVKTIYVKMDYEILTHFSKNLYTSPYKAIEELVVNGFDAGARNVYVTTASAAASDVVAVWDDGGAMDETGLERLWWIARSPKEEQREHPKTRRKVIGKFGIGKLASFSLGSRLTHLCRISGRWLRVTVDTRGVPRVDLSPNDDQGPSYPAEILELSEAEAREYVESVLGADNLIEAMWDSSTWTLAIIDALKGATIKDQRLRWLLGTGMPLRDDFAVYVDRTPVESKLGGTAFRILDIGHKDIREPLEASWRKEVASGDLVGDLTWTEADDGRWIVGFPNLGEVQATIRLFKESLHKGKAAELGRSHGFFIRVLDRLINPDDDKFLLHEPSYQTFYRSQFEVSVDQLDAALLADRERIDVSWGAVPELSFLQHALYLAARDQIGAWDDDLENALDTAAILPTDNRDVFRRAVTALALRRDVEGVRAADSQVRRKVLAEPDRMAELESGGFVVNTGHPLLEVLTKKIPESKRNREAHRLIDLMAVSGPLLEGELWDIGLKDKQISTVINWWNDLFTLVAQRWDVVEEDLVARARKTSYKGGREFEKAVAELFFDMGLKAEWKGAAGEGDVLVVAPLGRERFSLSVEAKGSKHPVPADNAQVGAAASHRDKAGAAHAVIVAREFAGLSKEDSAVVQEADAVKGVSIATIDVLAELHRVIKVYQYPLTVIKEVLTENTTPAAMLSRLQDLSSPTRAFDYAGVLRAIWETQGERTRPVAIYDVMESHDEWKKMADPDFTNRLIALHTLSDGLLSVIEGDKFVVMTQAPDLVVERIEANLQSLEW